MLWFVIEEALDFREFHKQSRVLSYTIIHIVLHKFLYVHHWLLEKKMLFFLTRVITCIGGTQLSDGCSLVRELVKHLFWYLNLSLWTKKKGRDVSNLTKLDAD